ncbi:MAG: hypothetical protein ACPIB0_01770 [Akkermansiaceae bacterium]
MAQPLWILAFASLVLCSCGTEHAVTAPVIRTPAGAKVDFSMVSFHVEDAIITRISEKECQLKFSYILDNKAGAAIEFPCLYNNTDELIEVNLEHKDKAAPVLGKRPLEGLTLTEPKPLVIPRGKTTRDYQVPVSDGAQLTGDTLQLRVRLHAPSRYDELRSSLEAPRIILHWPK